MIPDKDRDALQGLIVLAAEKKAAMEAAETAFKMVRSDIETICDEYGVEEMVAGDNKLEIRNVSRFKRYKDDKAVLDLLPKDVHVLDVMSLDRKKINKLIDDGKLPEEIKKLEKSGESVSIYFKKV